MKINFIKVCYSCLLLLLISVSWLSAWTIENLMHRMDVCSMPPTYGPCNGNLRKWYYSDKTRKCKQFKYSGCGGNDNRFFNKAECEEYCII